MQNMDAEERTVLIQHVRDWLQLLRIGNSTVIGFAAFTGYFVGGGRELLTATILFVSAFLIGGYGNIINDVLDVEIDRVNKPWRPLPSGRVSIRTAGIAAWFLLGTGLFLAVLLGIPSFLTAISAGILLYCYSRWVKKKGFLGNLVISVLSFMVILYGGLSSPDPLLSLLPGIYAFFIILGREVLKGLEDIEGDRAHGVGTIAVVYGIRSALVAASVFLSIVVVISPLPYLLGWMNTWYLVFALLGVDFPIIISLLRVWRNPVDNAWYSTRILKIPLLMGLIAFTTGVLA